MIITIIIITTLIFIKCIGYIVNEREQNKRHKKFIKNFKNYDKQRGQNKRDNS